MDEVRNTLFKKMNAAGRSNEISAKFKLMDTDELRVAMALSIMETFKITPQAKTDEKNSEWSISCRNEANRIFVSSKDNVDDIIKAWESYSKSIALARLGSEELSVAYANRSGLLLKLNKFEECKDDINRALELNYPNHLKGKLLCRKIECLDRLNEKDNIKDTIEKIKEWLENIKLDNDEKRKYEEKLKNTENLNPNLKSNNKSKKVKDLPTMISNKKIPCASEALTIKYNDKFGRHIVTTRKVNPGEVLVIEKPYAKILMPNEVHTHCSHCLQVHWAMIPCHYCIYAMYCSIECRNEARKQYHDVECIVTGYLLDLDFNKNQLFSLRLAIQALKESGSIEKLKNDLEKAEACQDPLKRGFGEDGLYQSDIYSSVYNLVTNTEKRSISDLFERALSAAFILYYVCTQTNLFGSITDIREISTNEDATYFGGLILRHMQIIPSNIHSVFSYFDYEEERKMATVDIGSAALPFCSLMNHSCDPNVSRCTAKDYMIIFAITPIEKGSQIFDNYGSHYAVMDKFEREDKLKQYYFKCECPPCQEDWPTYPVLKSYTKLLLNKDVKKKIEKALENFQTYLDYATENKIDNKPYLLTELARMIEVLMKYVPLPCYEVNNVVETLKRVFALLYGNMFETPKLV